MKTQMTADQRLGSAAMLTWLLRRPNPQQQLLLRHLLLRARARDRPGLCQMTLHQRCRLTDRAPEIWVPMVAARLQAVRLEHVRQSGPRSSTRLHRDLRYSSAPALGTSVPSSNLSLDDDE